MSRIHSIVVLLAISWFGGVLQAAPPTSGGPGGLGDTSGTSILELWLKAEEIVGKADGSTVASEWEDRSGNGNHCQSDPGEPGGKTSGAGDPQFYASATPNNGPAIYFDNDCLFTATEHMDLPQSHSYVFAARDMDDGPGYWLWFQHQGNLLNNDDDDIRGPGVGQWSENEWVLRDHMGPAAWQRADNSVNVDRWQVYTVQRAGNELLQMIRGGIAETVTQTNTWTGSFGVGTNKGAMLLGKHAGNPAQYIKGYMSEVMVFTTDLNTAQRIIVENYVSAKHFTNSLSLNDRYAGDTTANGNYDLDVFGIGKAADAEQLTANGCAGLGIEATAALANDAWVMAGHRETDNKLIDSDLPTGVGSRWARVWYLDKTGSVDVDLAFDHSDGNITPPSGTPTYTLLYSPSLPFSFSALAASPSVSGDTVTFSVTDAALPDGYYTLGLSISPPGPGAVTIVTDGGPGGMETTDGSSALQVWLDAGAIQGVADGDTVTTEWTDLSGAGNGCVSEPNGGGSKQGGDPTYAMSATPSSRPAVRFDQDTLFTTTEHLALPTAHSVLCAAKALGQAEGTGYTGALLTFQHQGNGATTTDDLVGVEPVMAYKYGTEYAIRRYDGATPSGAAETNMWHIYATIAGSTAVQGYLDGSSMQFSAANNWTGSFGTGTNQGAFLIGKHVSNVPQYCDGDVAEIIVITTNLNHAERAVLENYLSAKHFATPLPANDRYAGDTTANGDYDLDVLGIGNMGGSNKATAAGRGGFGISEIYNSLNPNEWVLAGHNGTAHGWTPLENMAGQRWQRIWYIDVTGSCDAMITFDHTVAGLAYRTGVMHLLYRASSGAEWTILDVKASTDGNRVSFPVLGTDLKDGYYTLGRLHAGTLISVR